LTLQTMMMPTVMAGETSPVSTERLAPLGNGRLA
jgi:hypothetical protein